MTLEAQDTQKVTYIPTIFFIMKITFFREIQLNTVDNAKILVLEIVELYVTGQAKMDQVGT